MEALIGSEVCKVSVGIKMCGFFVGIEVCVESSVGAEVCGLWSLPLLDMRCVESSVGSELCEILC